ncbi:MAG: iron chelate uptake ABC transporter family permease subunit [Propionibacteriales bacterium]|nr:iron chelate uptake ABC transporter family permease subunit [Propionibacteriales bacterium]
MTAVLDRPVTTSAEQPRAIRSGLVTRNHQRFLGLLVAAAVMLLCAIVSLAVGSKLMPLETAWQALTAFNGSENQLIITELRVPRTVLAMIVGTGLAVAGCMIQALTRNPLADPGILGVNAGAAFAVVIGIGFFGLTTVGQYVWFALGGALVATVAVYLIGSAGRGTTGPIRMTLAGVALGAALAGFTTGLMLLEPTTFDAMRSWNAGSVAGRDLATMGPVLPLLAVGLVLALLCSRALNSIMLGDDLAASLGTHVGRTRVVVVIAVTLLAGSATAIAGPIGFVGLMVPHVVRWFVGPDQRWICAYAIFVGAILVLLSDILGRFLVWPGEMPVGIVTAFLGAPVLIFLVRRKKAASAP